MILKKKKTTQKASNVLVIKGSWGASKTSQVSTCEILRATLQWNPGSMDMVGRSWGWMEKENQAGDSGQAFIGKPEKKKNEHTFLHVFIRVSIYCKDPTGPGTTASLEKGFFGAWYSLINKKKCMWSDLSFTELEGFDGKWCGRKKIVWSIRHECD